MIGSFRTLQPPIDSVTAAIEDANTLVAACDAARRLGFGSKLAIHPRQISTINMAFSPTPEEVNWAKRVVAACDRSGEGALRVDGMMVDRPVIERAHRLLAATSLLAAKGPLSAD